MLRSCDHWFGQNLRVNKWYWTECSFTWRLTDVSPCESSLAEENSAHRLHSLQFHRLHFKKCYASNSSKKSLGKQQKATFAYFLTLPTNSIRKNTKVEKAFILIVFPSLYLTAGVLKQNSE